MRIVIDIPEEMVYRFKHQGEQKHYDYHTVLRACINGTPLPKGHGRLIDADKIEWYGCDFEGRDCIEAKGDCSVCDHANCYAKQVRELPTIIEADKE